MPLTATAAGNGTVRVKVSGPVGFCARTKLRARGAAAGANSGAAHDQTDRQGRKPDAVERRCLPISFPAPARCRFRSALRRRSMRRACWRRSIVIRSAARSRSRAARCRCFTSANWPRGTLSAPIQPPIERIREAIEMLLTRQDSNGSFGLWGVGGDDVWLDAYVTDFLTRARERKFAVPERRSSLALDRLRNVVANTTDPGKNGGDRSRLRTLRAGAQRVGADRRPALPRRRQARCAVDADRQGANRRRARHGRRSRREPSASMPRRWRRSRPAAAARSRQPRGLRLDVARRRRPRGARHRRRRGACHRAGRGAACRGGARRLRPTSTQEDAWLLLAANAMAKDAGKISLDVGGEPMSAPAVIAPFARAI